MVVDLLERAAALSKLGSLLAATAAAGRVVLVAGEAGIGKSALLRRFAEQHAADARFLAGACDPLLTPRALGPLHDIARQTRGRLAELLASGGSREAVFAAFLDQLVQPPQRQVVVVEDAHWADEATLDLLVFLWRRLERTPAMLIVTYRDDELGADHPLRGVLGVLPQQVAHRVRPQPLSEAAVAELARRAGRPAAGLRALTGGNPAAGHRGAGRPRRRRPHDRPRPGAGALRRPTGRRPGGGAAGRCGPHPGRAVAAGGGVAAEPAGGGGVRRRRAAGRRP